MKKLTLKQVRYILRGVSEELRTDIRISGEKWETTKLFAAYSENLHGAPTDAEAHRLIVTTLERLAQLWEYWFNDPERYTEKLAESECERLEIIDSVLGAFADK